MNLKILVDNNTIIDHYFLGEPGVSFFIEIDNIHILFDLGYSDIFLSNGIKMGIDFLNIDHIVLSHAHLDHTWGLQHLIQRYTDARCEKTAVKHPSLVAHPLIFASRTYAGLGEIGSLISEEKAKKYFDLQLTSKPVWLHPKLVFLGEIERTTSFEAKTPIGKIHGPDGHKDDYIFDDSALVYQSDKGLVVITGCAHAGICNTVEYAMKVCNETRIADIIGGFHLMDAPESHITQTMKYFKKWQPAAVHACHCTDFQARRSLANVVPMKEVGSGLELSYF